MIKNTRTVNLGLFVQDGTGTLHGKFSGLGIGSTSIISESATSLEGKPYLKLIADPLGAAYEVGVAFPKEKNGMKYYSALLDSPIFPAPLNVALFPDKEVHHVFKLVWNRPAVPKPTAEATRDAGGRSH
jgi:uncharacterized protein (DUF736 family)